MTVPPVLRIRVLPPRGSGEVPSYPVHLTLPNGTQRDLEMRLPFGEHLAGIILRILDVARQATGALSEDVSPECVAQLRRLELVNELGQVVSDAPARIGRLLGACFVPAWEALHAVR